MEISILIMIHRISRKKKIDINKIYVLLFDVIDRFFVSFSRLSPVSVTLKQVALDRQYLAHRM